MSKIWMVNYGSYSGRKYYKTETAFLEAIGSSHAKATVTIFEEVESHNALEYKSNLILQREREQQLAVILDDNKEVGVLNQIKSEIEKFEKERIANKGNSSTQWVVRSILRKFENRGMSFKMFKGMITDNSIRNFLIYNGPNSLEWYKLLFTCHNFSKIEESYGSVKNPTIVDKTRVDNFNRAKEEVKQEKKNEKKNISV
jgi:hypothetical protein